MDEKIKQFLDQKKVDRPVLSMRQVGNRIEIYLLGGGPPLVYQEKQDPASQDPAVVHQRPCVDTGDGGSRRELEGTSLAQPAGPYTSAQLSKMKMPELKKMAGSLGIPVKGRKKITLITNILKAQEA